MPILPLALATREGHSIAIDSERVINMFVEFSQGGKTVAALVNRPGSVLWTDLGGFPVRGWYATRDKLYVVARSTFYVIEESGQAVAQGTLDSVDGRVQLADNGKEIMIVDGTVGGGYIYDYILDSFQKITATDFTTLVPTWVTAQDTYFIVNDEGTFNYYLSAPFDGLSWTADATSVGTAEKDPTPIVALISDHGQLIIFCEESIEVHYNVGTTPFPFTRAEGVQIEVGLAAPFSMQRFDNSIAFIGRTKGAGALRVFRFVGNNVQRISNDALEHAFDVRDLVQASAAVITISGHEFYILNFPSAGETRVHDAALAAAIGNDAWQEWRSGSNNNGCQCHAFLSDLSIAFNDRVYLADPHNGRIYEIDEDVYDDNGTPFPTVVRTGHITDEERRMTHQRFDLITERGVGLENQGTHGHDPYAVLRWSNDNGFTWSSEHRRCIGKLGEYGRRTRWNRLGRVRDRVYEVSMDSPVKRVFVGMLINGPP